METIRRKIVKIRKRHRCSACLRWFEAGTEMESGTFKDDDIYTIYSCETCQQLTSEYPDSFLNDDCFPEGCVDDELSEHDCETPEELYDKFVQWKRAKATENLRIALRGPL